MPNTPDSRTGVILWDMAGTLLSSEEGTNKLCAMPGCEGALGALHQDHTLIVATGDFAASARLMLREVGLLEYFADIYGTLWAPVGKPYGEILTEWDVPQERCLAIGDRLNFDIPADCSRLVTVVVNQNGFTLHGDAIVELVRVLAANGEDYYSAFQNLMAKAESHPATDGSGAGSHPRRWRDRDGLDFELTWHRHAALPEERPVIVLPG